MLEVIDVTVGAGTRTILDGVRLRVPEGDVVSVLGPSGAGKSTLLRVIAGLQPPERGVVRWRGRDVTGVPPHRRGFGLMFQDFALFPHRDVAANVGFGLRMQGVDGRSAARRVDEVLDLVGLSGFGPRSVGTLSGGEQQRVALARSLAPSPEVLLLDEPMGSLDRVLRERLPLELRAIFAELRLTVVAVTHDQHEAFTLGRRVVVLHEGRVIADDTPEALWSRPPSPFVATFLGFRNVATAIVVDGVARTPWGSVPVPGVADGRRTVLLRADGFSADAEGPITGIVTARVFRGDHELLHVAVPGAPPLEVHARWPSPPAEGEAVRLAIRGDAVVALDAAPLAGASDDGSPPRPPDDGAPPRPPDDGAPRRPPEPLLP
jgi:thiamine transport system ATP-binding protein